MKVFVELTAEGWEIKFIPLSKGYFYFSAKIFLNSKEESCYECSGFRSSGNLSVIQSELDVYAVCLNDCIAIAMKFESCLRDSIKYGIFFNPLTGLTSQFLLMQSLREIELTIGLHKLRKCSFLMEKRVSDCTEAAKLFKEIRELADEAISAIGHPERRLDFLLNSLINDTGNQMGLRLQKLSEIEWSQSSEYLER